MQQIPDKQYEDWGVDPPSHEPHGTAETIKYAMEAQKVVHEWRQRGAQLFCVACPFEHATEPKFVDYLLQGTDAAGLPILKKL